MGAVASEDTGGRDVTLRHASATGHPLRQSVAIEPQTKQSNSHDRLVAVERSWREFYAWRHRTGKSSATHIHHRAHPRSLQQRLIFPVYAEGVSHPLLARPIFPPIRLPSHSSSMVFFAAPSNPGNSSVEDMRISARSRRAIRAWLAGMSKRHRDGRANSSDSFSICHRKKSSMHNMSVRLRVNRPR